MRRQLPFGMFFPVLMLPLLVGAGVLHLSQLCNLSMLRASIGGAGAFDEILLTDMFSVVPVAFA